MAIATRHMARDVQSFDISQLPPDLAQLVFNELLLSSTIDEATFSAFGSQHIYEFDCSEQNGVTDKWLSHFVRSPLLRVSLASCVQVCGSVIDFSVQLNYIILPGCNVSTVYQQCILISQQCECHVPPQWHAKCQCRMSVLWPHCLVHCVVPVQGCSLWCILMLADHRWRPAPAGTSL